MAEFVALQKLAQSGVEGTAESENSWTVGIKDIDQATFDLSAKNPNKKEETALRQPQEILAAMKALDDESSLIMNNLQLIIDNER